MKFYFKNIKDEKQQQHVRDFDERLNRSVVLNSIWDKRTDWKRHVGSSVCLFVRLSVVRWVHSISGRSAMLH